MQDVSGVPFGLSTNCPKSRLPQVCSLPPSCQAGGVIVELTSTPWVEKGMVMKCWSAPVKWAPALTAMARGVCGSVVPLSKEEEGEVESALRGEGLVGQASGVSAPGGGGVRDKRRWWEGGPPPLPYVEVAETAGDSRGVSMCERGIGLCYEGEGRLAAAREHVGRALEISTRLNDPYLPTLVKDKNRIEEKRSDTAL